MRLSRARRSKWSLATTSVRFKVTLCQTVKTLNSASKGRVASLALLDPDRFAGRNIKLAGDELTMEQVRQAYAKVENRTVRKAWAPGFVTRLLPHEMRTMFTFFVEKGYTADFASLRQEFPGMLTLEDWLKQQQQKA